MASEYPGLTRSFLWSLRWSYSSAEYREYRYTFLATSIPMDAMSDSVDAGELLGINVEHRAWFGVLVQAGWVLLFIESPAPARVI